ncbi:S-adenosyl-L-methionine-dependent methyltransferase [Dacryopinax primogenitus]|uniref:S-adenosyl-L-methionine-dependent methyltransferase n=1 Tax=Dacryopinax primogenitus (strain DJM 731) TaxID=1858805 RepID=M5FQS8_DACPD|nr:S-adenosyl-L-methionine-dependent methyltransferase [Dacryopinax primogenitus]EJT99310.1 S-adenosyl-L-methionine-dependent methyltransferase [Dacryopinax primogenitus]
MGRGKVKVNFLCSFDVVAKPDRVLQKQYKGKGDNGAATTTKRTNEWGVPSENPKFRAYYEAQNIMPAAEWPAFINSMMAPLPTTFRVTGSRATAQELNELIKAQYLPSLTGITFEDQPIDPPKQISWYPQGLVWQLNLAKRVLRKLPEFRAFQLFLVYETDAGNISRQELVSMIPPLLLDVQPHHIVMDMCAAPGSKSAQLIEALHSGDAESIPSGLLVANDSDYKRTHMLVHQAGRLASPALMVTNVDASHFTNIKVPAEPPNTGLVNLKFDRILADVPCTGDGTLRKNINIWRDWSITAGNGMHSLQLRILLRGMKMLKPGGLIAYSTCSLNPVENEAVLAAAINQSSDEFVLADVSDRLPGLVTRPGMSKWTVAIDREGTLKDTFAEYEEAMKDSTDTRKRVLESCWPPQDVGDLHLERAMRILPQDQDTGAFFVALLRKVAKTELPSSTAQDTTSQKRKAEEELDGQPGQKRAKVEAEEEPEGQTGGTYAEQPFRYIAEDNAQMQEGLKTLNLLPSFPSNLLFARSSKAESIRSVYLTNSILKTILQHNDIAKIRLINCGTKVIADHGTPQAGKAFRFMHDGVSLILPHIKPEGILHASTANLKILLASYNPTFEEQEEPFRTALRNKTGTSYLVRVEPTESEILKQPFILPLWRAAASAGLLLDKKARSALSLRVFGEDVSPAGKDQEKNAKEKEDKAEEADVEAAVAVEEAELADLELEDKRVDIEETAGPERGDADVREETAGMTQTEISQSAVVQGSLEG